MIVSLFPDAMYISDDKYVLTKNNLTQYEVRHETKHKQQSF